MRLWRPRSEERRDLAEARGEGGGYVRVRRAERCPLKRGTRRKVSFLVPLIRDSSRHKPPSSPISSLFSYTPFLSFTSISSTLQFSTSGSFLSISRPHVPAVCLSLLTLTMNTTSPCLGVSETQLQELPRDLQEHEKAFRV